MWPPPTVSSGNAHHLVDRSLHEERDSGGEEGREAHRAEHEAGWRRRELVSDEGRSDDDRMEEEQRDAVGAAWRQARTKARKRVDGALAVSEGLEQTTEDRKQHAHLRTRTAHDAAGKRVCVRARRPTDAHERRCVRHGCTGMGLWGTCERSGSRAESRQSGTKAMRVARAIMLSDATGQRSGERRSWEWRAINMPRKKGGAITGR
jgi:hypothetical protein